MKNETKNLVVCTIGMLMLISTVFHQKQLGTIYKKWLDEIGKNTITKI